MRLCFSTPSLRHTRSGFEKSPNLSLAEFFWYAL